MLLFIALYLAVVSATDCDITSYGAVGNNQTDCTVSINAAIKACANRSGAVVFPAPGVYLSWPLYLPSNLKLVIEKGATLLAHGDHINWPNSTNGWECATTPYEAKDPIWVPQKANFINCDGESVTLTGGGVIDGQGWRWWPLRKLPGDYWHNCRPKLVAGYPVSNLIMHNITLRNSPMYNVAMGQVKGARFTHVTIDSNPGIGYLAAPNTGSVVRLLAFCNLLRT
jgi:polygalacturonase